MRAVLLMVLAACAVVPSRARAQIDAHVTVEGTCPDRSAALAGLGGWIRPVPADRPALLRIRIERVEAGSRLSVEPLDASLPRAPLERELDDEDCAAIAEAFGVIVTTHLLHLALIDDRTPPPPADPPPALEPAPVAEPEPAAEPEPSPAPEPSADEPVPPPVRARDRMRFGVGFEGGVALDPLSFVGLGSLDATYAPASLPLGVRLAVGYGAMPVQVGPVGALDVRLVEARVDGVLTAAWPGLALDVNVGLGFWAIEALLREPVERGTWRALPLLAAAVALRIPAGAIGMAIWLRARVFPWPERYLVQPAGEVGRSPAAVLSLGLAVSFDTII